MSAPELERAVRSTGPNWRRRVLILLIALVSIPVLFVALQIVLALGGDGY